MSKSAISTYRMAFLLQKSVTEIESMSLPDYQNWQAYFSEYPPVDQVLQDYMARFMALFANANGGKGLTIKEFYCDYEPVEQMTVEEKIQAAFGGMQ